MQYKVSIIVPCYNQSQFLNTTLLSVFDQTHGDWECIIVDDGSIDDTQKIALEWTLKDSRFIYIRQNNLGLSAARNLGLTKAKGAFIQFLDSDDFMYPEKLEKQLDCISRNCPDSIAVVCVSNFLHGTLDGKWVTSFPSNNSLFLTKNYLKELILNWESKLTIPAHAFLFSSDLFLVKDLRFKVSLKNHEDIHCWIRLFNQFPKVFQIDEKLVIYRDNPNSLSKQMRTMGEGYLEALSDLRDSGSFNNSLIRLFNKKINLVRLSYKMFDLMRFEDKVVCGFQLVPYYFKRILQKLNISAA